MSMSSLSRNMKNLSLLNFKLKKKVSPHKSFNIFFMHCWSIMFTNQFIIGGSPRQGLGIETTDSHCIKQYLKIPTLSSDFYCVASDMTVITNLMQFQELRNSFFYFEGHFKVEITIKKQLTTPEKQKTQPAILFGFFIFSRQSFIHQDIVFERIFFFLLPWCLPFEHSRTKVISVGKVIWNQASFTNSIKQGLCMFHWQCLNLIFFASNNGNRIFIKKKKKEIIRCSLSILDFYSLISE